MDSKDVASWDAGSALSLSEATGSDGNTYKEKPLFWATRNGLYGILKKLLECDIDLEWRNSAGDTALAVAASKKSTAVVTLLLEKGANLESTDGDSYTPLAIAVYYGQEAVVELLLEKGANIESKGDKGNTPLALAAIKGEKESPSYLSRKAPFWSPKITSAIHRLS